MYHHNTNRLIISFLYLASAGFGVAAIISYHNKKALAASATEPELLNVAASSVIGASPNIQGVQNSPYTLVEFGDYQCPPCRIAYRRLPFILGKLHGRVQFTFRNFPLTQIHAYAMPAAIAAEAASEQGKFWPAHDYLYETDLSTRSIQSVVAAKHLAKNSFEKSCLTTASKAVLSDIAAGQRLGIDSTPSFILCCPSGKVLKLKTLDQVSDIVDGRSMASSQSKEVMKQSRHSSVVAMNCGSTPIWK